MKGLVVLLWLVMVPMAWGHDIGVAKASMVELPDHRYQLSVQAPSNIHFFFPEPALPNHCRYIDQATERSSRERLSFSFQCRSALTADNRISMNWKRTGLMLAAEWRSGDLSRQFFKSSAGIIEVDLAQLKAGSGSFLLAAKRYTVLGSEHILSGIDHLLFVLGLLLLVRGVPSLVKTITAFTVAHSITLALATLGVVRAPAQMIEAVIALSIIFVAVEIINGWRGQPSTISRKPWQFAFCFGLLHGFGFAGALSAVGLPDSEVPIALLFFNIGVELGQLAFVLLVLTGYQLIKQSGAFSSRWGVPVAGYAIGLLSTVWFSERMLAVITG